MEPVARPRTSVMAILSLVMGGLCCLPITGPVAVALGGASLYSISRSEGRLTGKPMAVIGLVLGLISAAVWVSFAVGASSEWNSVRQSAMRMVTALENGDIAGVRQALPLASKAGLTDLQVQRFSAEVQTKLGKVKGVPTNFGEIIKYYMNIRSALPPEILAEMTDKTNPVRYVPLPVDFEKGRATVLLRMTQSGQNITSALDLVENLVISLPDGTLLRLIEKPTPGATPLTTPESDPAADAPTEVEKKKPGF